MNTVALSGVFEVVHGTKLDLNKMSKCAFGEDAIAFIGRSRERNGLVSFVDRCSSEPFQEGLITVALGGSALSSFVQPRPFYTAQNVDVLIPPEDMCLDVKFFYCLCIEANSFRYSTYGREANRTLKSILVPDPDDLPGWVSGTVERAIVEFTRALSSRAKMGNGKK